MTTLAQLEDQINALNALNRSSAKALDTFADTSNAIAVRARQITRDVKPWEVAQENIALTIEEMSKAARCYHPPPSLYAVLARRETDPEAVARCIDYLVYTDDYLSSHPPNDFGDEIQAKTESQLRQIVMISEEYVKTSFLKALQKPVSTTTQAYGATAGSGGLLAPGRAKNTSAVTDRGLVIKNPSALTGVGQVIQRLGENFNRTEVVQDDVRSMLETKMKTLINSQFDSAYREEEVGKAHTSAHAGVSAVMKHYQRGDHRLLAISQLARKAAVEVGECVNEHIVAPLDSDYAVAEMPGALAASLFDVIIARALAVINFDKSVFSNPTRMFVESRGQGIGLYSGARYFRDIVFVGLDIVEDLWAWKALAATFPGDHDNLIDHVDNEIEHFIFEVRELLDAYVSCKGALDKSLLKEYTLARNSVEWFPSADCTAHESTTNVMYFHKVLLTSYYGALKVALYGNTLSPSAEDESVREVEDYLLRCVLGSIQELHVIAETIVEMQEESGAKHQGRFWAKDGRVHLAGGGEATRLSPEIFLLNNIMFLEQNYRREPCFSLRVLPAEEEAPKDKTGGSSSTTPRSKGAAAAKPATVPITTHILAMLADEREQCVDDFGRSWELCFPTSVDDPELGTINPDPTQPLRKSQRMALKKWHKAVSENLAAKIADGKVHTVMSSAIRSALIERSIATVLDSFGAFDDVVRGRTWSSRPTKWMPLSREEIVEKIKKMF